MAAEPRRPGPDEESTVGHVRPQSAVYKGPPPHLLGRPGPGRPDRRRRIADAAEARAMLDARAIAQQPLVEAGDRIQSLVGEREYDGFANLALEDNPLSLVLRWKGPLPEPVQHLVDELDSTLQVVVRDAMYSRDELLREARRIMNLDRPSSVKIWSAGPLTDCGGLHVTIDQSTDMAHAKQAITSPMRLEFSVSGQVVLA